MKKWEYTTVYCGEIEFSRDIESKEIYPLLDPEYKYLQNMTDDTTKFTAQLAFLLNDGYYMELEKALNKLGKEGWEVIAITPPWSSATQLKVLTMADFKINETGQLKVKHDFHILCKRPKE